MPGAGVGAVEPNAAAMMAPARAAEATAAAVAKTASTIEAIALRVGRARNLAAESEGRSLLKQFEGDMTRMVLENPNQEQWLPAYEQEWGKIRGELDKLDLSPDGRQEFERYIDDWQSRQQQNLLTAAAKATFERSRQAVTNEVKFALDANDRAGGVEAIERGRGVVFTDEQAEAMLHEFERDMDARDFMMEAQGGDVLGVIERLEADDFHEKNPKISPEKRLSLLRFAIGQREEARREEDEALETMFMTGDLTGSDIEAAEFLTKKDRINWHRALKNAEPPDAETLAQAWGVTDELRAARNDPRITQEHYRELHNEARTVVRGLIAPNFQGDILKELNYLSPAGRHPAGGGFEGTYTKEDLTAAGRDAVRRMREAGVFGDLSQFSRLSKSEREDAFRKAMELEIDVKNFVRSNEGNLTPQAVWEYVDERASGSRAATAPKILPSAPGSGRRLRPTTFEGVLPSLGEQQQLDSFLDDE